MKEATTIAKGSSWTLLSNLLTKLISFIYYIILAKFLITEEIGIFFLVLSTLGILYMFTDLGMIYSLSRYVPYLYGKNEFGKLKKLIRLSYFGGGTLTFLFSVVVFLLSNHISEFIGKPAVAPIMQLMSIWLLLKEIDGINRGILTGRKKMLESKGLETAQIFMKLVLTIVAFYMVGFNAEALSIGFLLSFLFVLPFGVYLVLKEIKTWKNDEIKMEFEDQLSLGREIVSFGLIVTLITTMWTVIQYTDRLMLNYFVEDALNKIAIYSMALGLANLVLIFPTAITIIFFPVVSELYGKKEFGKMNKTLRVSMKWLLMLVIPFALIMGVFGDNLLELFYGKVYGSGAIVLFLFVIGLFARSIFTLPQLILSAMRRLDVELKAIGIAAIANVLLNFILIPTWGINGAAFASMISFFVLSVMIFYYSKKIFKFSFPEETYKPLIAGFVSLTILFILKIPIIFLITNYLPTIQVGISDGQFADELMRNIIALVMFGFLFLLSVLVYLVILLLLKSLEKEELSVLEAGLRKARVPDKYNEMLISFLEAKWLKNPFG